MISSTFIDHIICGAAKSGTTYVADILGKSGKVDFCIRKEPNFFCHKENSGNHYKGTAWYNNLFANNGLPKCEASTRYMYADESPRLIYMANNKVKLIFMLRNPVERVYSDYWENIKRGKKYKDIKTDLREKKLDPLIDVSRYGKHLKKYYDVFPSHQILVLIYETLLDDKKLFFEKLFDFMGINVGENVMQRIITLKNSNLSAIPRSSMLSRLYFNYKLRHYLEFLPYPINSYLLSMGTRVKPLILKKKKYPLMTDEVRRILSDCLIGDIMQTEKLLNMDLSGWIKTNQ